MKIIQIALKDLRRSFRSAFLLVMMFVAPLLITGLLYLAFGNVSGGQGGFSLPVTRVQVANLDQPDARSGLAAGQLLVQYLRSEKLAGLFQPTLAPDEVSARNAVDRREADVALIVPANFTAAVLAPNVQAAVTLYHDPVQTVGPRVLGTVVRSYLDGFSGSKIAAEVTDHQLTERGLTADPMMVAGVAERYAEWAEITGHDGDTGSAALVTRSPLGENPSASQNLFLAPMMAGMLLLFVFFTGAATAQSIIYEDEQGTLARLFTTPTSRATILMGKLVGVLVVLVAQAAVLMVASRLLFGINWGRPEVIVLLTATTAIVAGGFGVFLMSLVRTTRQAGVVLGAVVSMTGILGGLVPTGDPSQPSPFETLSLALPQGWAMRGWRLALGGAEVVDILLCLAVLLVAGGILLAIGTLIFRRRFA